MTDYKLVYSTDPAVNKKCPQCKELVSVCSCNTDTKIPKNITAKLRLEKAKRGGKTVTVIRELPAVDEYLKSLAKELKVKCGTGGTHGVEDNQGYIEIQGDHRESIRAALQKKGITVKG